MNQATKPPIHIFEPYFAGREKEYVAQAMESGWVSSQGPFIRRFEEAFAQYHGVTEAVSCSNCTTALHLALSALGVGPGDEVLCPDLTFIAPANMIALTGALPVLVDVEADSLALDPGKMEAAITARCKAVVVVHQFGHAAPMDAILEIAARHGLFVIEDVAEAIGARHQGRMLGTLGHAACFSFFGNKIITTGEGGMVITGDSDLASRLRLYRDHGMRPERRYHHEVLGFNYRLTNLQAALGLAQLEQLDHILALRAAQADHYARRVAAMPGVSWRANLPYSQSVHWLSTIHLDRPEWRAPVMQHLRDAGIEPRPMIFPVHYAPYFGYSEDDPRYPVARAMSLRSLHLPSSTGLTAAELDRVCDVLEDALAKVVPT